MPLYCPDYNHTLVHRQMLSDAVRTSALMRAVCAYARPGSVVVDLGCGAGILAAKAARCGARVYAIERTGIAEVARTILENNDLLDRINLIQADSREVDLPETADLLISECIGVHLFQEDMLATFLDARDRFLKPDGRIVPLTISLWLAPLRHCRSYQTEVAPWKDAFHGFNFHELYRLSLREQYVEAVQPEQLTHAGAKALSLDMRTVVVQPAYEMLATFRFERSERIEGLCGWFEAELAPGVVLRTSPSDPPTHWRQAVYPMEPFEVHAGESLHATVRAEPHDGMADFTWSVRVEGAGRTHEATLSTRENYTQSMRGLTESGASMDSHLLGSGT